MDKNSRMGKTSESVENTADGESPGKTENGPDSFPDKGVGVVIDRGGGNIRNQASDCCASFVDASGPSSNFSPVRKDDKTEGVKGEEETENKEEEEVENVNELDDDDEDSETKLPVVYAQQFIEDHNAEGTTGAEERAQGEETPIGPPPSYSFVMKQKKKGRKTSPTTDPLMPDWPPPPVYGGIQGVYTSPDEGRICNLRDFSSLTEPIWRSHSQPALCPRCGILVLTSIHAHDSIATHVTALALCLFGCWPCCLLPYCMNVCKNTYHHCPICQTFLGAYTPW